MSQCLHDFLLTVFIWFLAQKRVQIGYNDGFLMKIELTSEVERKQRGNAKNNNEKKKGSERKQVLPLAALKKKSQKLTFCVGSKQEHH